MGWHEKRFWRLVRESDVRMLSAREQRYLARMRERRPDLAESERAEQDAMTVFRLAAVHHVPSETFDTQLFRRYQVASIKSSVSYWSPAMIGATVAAVAVLAVLQLLSSSSELKPIDITGTEVRRTVGTTTVFPEIGPQFPSRVR